MSVHTRRPLVLFAVCALLVSLLSTPARATGTETNYLIDATDLSAAAAAVAAAGGTVTGSFPEIGSLAATSADPAFASAVAASPGVRSVTEDPEVSWIGGEQSAEAGDEDAGAMGVNTEPRASFQWNMRQIRADVTAAAGDLGCTAKRARVAVIDTGVYSKHEDLAANLNMGLSRSFVPGEPTAEFQPATNGAFSHGTHVSGIIAAPINGKGVQGVAPCAEIVPVKVLRSSTGSGSFGGVIRGILYASTIDADVINMSLGATFSRVNAGGGGLGPLISALNRAINHATSSGVLVVSAAGNESADLNRGTIWSIPAQSGNGMAVSATGPIALANFDRLASYSNFGQSVIDVAAPGGDFTRFPALTPVPWFFDMVLSPGAVTASGQSRYFFAAGTSMAAPHVAGVAALYVGRFGKTPPSQVRSAIQQGAVDILKPGTDAASGKGRIDAPATLGR